MNIKTSALLITAELNNEEVAALVAQLQPKYNLTILSDRPLSISEDVEIWVAQRLGFLGCLALVRRIAWHKFAIIYQPHSNKSKNKRGIFWACLPYLIAPRPEWAYQI